MKPTARRALLGAAAVAAALLVWAVVAAVLARGDAVRARERLAAVRDGEGADPAAALAAARADLARALDRLAAPGPAAVRRVPVLGRSWVALTVTSRAGLAAVEAGQAVLAVTEGGRPLLADSRVDLAQLAALRSVLADHAGRAAGPVAALGRLRTGWTPPQVGRGVTAARAELRDLPEGLRRAADAIGAVAGVTGAVGERRILVVLQNNAELRGTGGLISVFAEATARDGRIRLGGFRDVLDVAASPAFAKPVPAPADYVARYGRFLANTTLWRNANMAPDVPTSAAVLADLARLSLGRRPDAVLLVDVRAIAAILDATGPVRLPGGRQIDGDGALEDLLVRAYAEAPDTRAGQDERRRRLRTTADAVVARLFDGGSSPVDLGLALGRASAGRHLALWSAHPAEQAAFAAAGVAGAVRADGVDLAMVSVQNLGGGRGEGNKLDYYARRSLAVSVAVGRDEAVTTQRFRLRNTAPAGGLPRYVAGLERPGETRNLLSFAVPAGAVLEAFERGGVPVRTTVSTEGGYRVLEDLAVLAPGAEAEWTLRYRVPLRDGRYDLRLVPQPLAVDAELSVEVRPERGVYVEWTGAPGTLREGWARERHVSLRVVRGSVWRRVTDRVRRFWNEPVRLG